MSIYQGIIWMYENIPLEMKTFRQWIVWRLEDTINGKPTKIPYNPISGRLASVTDPSTWCSFEESLKILNETNLYSGIGFVLTNNDPFCFIDLDYTTDEKQFERQKMICESFNSYSELSPSGHGLHIITRGSVPSGRKRDKIEIYSDVRYMTMTGNVWRNEPIKDYNKLCNILWEEIGKSKSNVNYYLGTEEVINTDEEIHKIASEAMNGELYLNLFNGNWEDYYKSQSEADLALFDIIAFYTHNVEQITRIFRYSVLGQRKKAQRPDYIRYMVDKCFDNVLPPIDTEGLKNLIQEVIDNKTKNEREIKIKAPKQLKKFNEDFIKVERNGLYTAPPGLMGEIANFIYSKSVRPVPEIALAGAIGLMAGITGRAYNIEGMGLNQYTIAIASTGVGKEAMSSGTDILMSAAATKLPAVYNFIGPGEIASPQAIIKYMNKNSKSFVSHFDEIGLQMQAMCKINAPANLVGLRKFILLSYGKSGNRKSFKPMIYSDKDKNTDSIASPAFSILGDTTPEKFYEGLTEGLISEGFLPRFTVIEYLGNRPKRNKNHINVEPSFELIDKFTTLCQISLMLNTQNRVVDVGYEDDALDTLDKYDEYCDNQINATGIDIKRQFWTRAHAKALKLAAIVAVGMNPYQPIITNDVANWSINICNRNVQIFIDKFNAGEIGTDNTEVRQIKAVIDVISEYVFSEYSEIKKYAPNQGNLHYDKIIPYSFIQRKLVGTAIFRVDRIGSTASIKRTIGTLIERGDIQEVGRNIMATKYQTTSRAFMISNSDVFK